MVFGKPECARLAYRDSRTTSIGAAAADRGSCRHAPDSEPVSNHPGHPTYDAFWKELSIREKIDKIHVPVFSVGGWYDNYVEGDLEAFAALEKLSSKPDLKHRILIGPGRTTCRFLLPESISVTTPRRPSARIKSNGLIAG